MDFLLVQFNFTTSPKELMLSGYKIYEAAQMVGFDDVSYFSRVFKKYEGCSPREYEKK